MTWLISLQTPLALIVLIGSALMGGIFFAFSNFIMQALAKRPDADAIQTMQQINVTVLNPWFLGSFFATALASLGLIASTLMIVLTEKQSLIQTPGIYFILAAMFYVVGTFGVTIAGNVPLNETLKGHQAQMTQPQNNQAPTTQALTTHALTTHALTTHALTTHALTTQALEFWATYQNRWMLFNHIRTLCAILAVFLCGLGLLNT